MQTNRVSTHLTEILTLNSAREELNELVSKFLKKNKITVVQTNVFAKSSGTAAFNNQITESNKKRETNFERREKMIKKIRQLSTIEIGGETISRSAYEIAKLMRESGYRVTAPSITRIAHESNIKIKGLLK